MKRLLFVFLFVALICFGQEKNDNYIIQGSIFKVSYNEQYEQPNWIEYKVRNIKKITKPNLHTGPAQIGVIRKINTAIIFNLLSIILNQLLFP